MEAKNPLDKFGKFLVENLRDKGIDFAENLLKNHWKAPDLKEMQAELQSLSEKQKTIVRQAIAQTIDTAIHDFLFALQEEAEFENDIQILVDGENIVDLSDGIHGETYGKNGWYAKFSNFEQAD